jgi:hypothetical protein
MLVSPVVLCSALVLTASCMTIQLEKSPKIEARSSWEFLGCYTDSVSARSLPNGEAVPGGTDDMTNEACQAACFAAGFSIAGTEYAGECCKHPFIYIFGQKCSNNV